MFMRKVLILMLWIAVFLFSACSSAAPTTVVTEEPTAIPATSAPPEPTDVPPTAIAEPQPTDTAVPDPTDTLEPTAEPEPATGFLLTDAGFQTPESIRYDPQADVYLVANINGSPSAKDGNGFISRVSPQGEVIALKWIDGEADGVTLNGPKGMALAGDTLYVADIDVVRLFNRDTGEPQGQVEIAKAQFLNDVTADEDGKIYVTDSSSGAIHKIVDGAVETIATINGPNGIVAQDDMLLVTSGTDILLLQADGTTTPKYTAPQSGLDGLVLLADGAILVSSWNGSAVYHIDATGNTREIAKHISGPADIGWDAQRGLILIPHFKDSFVEVLPLP
jgi:sugar lactone lactonase YvrE